MCLIFWILAAGARLNGLNYAMITLKPVCVKGLNRHWRHKLNSGICIEVHVEKRLCQVSASGCFRKVVVRIHMR
jgi:hypothetical protein